MGFKGEPTSTLIEVQKSIFLVLGCKGQQCALCTMGFRENRNIPNRWEFEGELTSPSYNLLAKIALKRSWA